MKVYVKRQKGWDVGMWIIIYSQVGQYSDNYQKNIFLFEQESKSSKFQLEEQIVVVPRNGNKKRGHTEL